MIIVLTTAPNLEDAEMLAQQIIEAKLAACVQISAPIISYYVWKKKIQKDFEHQLFIKTLPQHFEKLRDFIEAIHSYETPEIIAIAAEKISEKYLNWANEVLQG